MATSVQDADAAFFNLMHHYLTVPHTGDDGAESGEPCEDRRDKARRAFRVWQQIAPGYCWDVPPATAWIEVLCGDLTQGGFSFFLDEKPRFDNLVAMFRPAEPIYVGARINHWRPVLVDDWGLVLDPVAGPARTVPAGRPTSSKYLVGCQFLRRFSS